MAWLARHPIVMTALLHPSGEGDWVVSWVEQRPGLTAFREPTLTAATSRATAEVVSLPLSPQDRTRTHVQLVIQLDTRPGAAGAVERRPGPGLDVQGVAGSYVARDVRGSGLVVRGPSLEALVAALPTEAGVRSGTLRWVRPVTVIGADGRAILARSSPAWGSNPPSALEEFWTRLVWRLVVPVGLVAGLVVFASGETAAWSAHQGHGTPGTWTFIESTCRSSCTGWGRFTSDDGREIHDRVIMVDTPQTMHPGDVVRGLSVDGDQIYPDGGGTTWLAKPIGMALTASALLYWYRTIPARTLRGLRRLRRRRHGPRG